MESAVTKEICALIEIVFISNLIFTPVGVLIVGYERRCIFLLEFKIPIPTRYVGWWSFAFLCVSHHGYDIFGYGGD